MAIVASIEEVRAIRRRQGAATLGFVPTMGYLHEGHLELVRRARRENDHVAVSIYVNPTQFAPTEDLSRYPRDLERDLALLRAEDVSFVFTPTDATMYPTGFQTSILIHNVTQPLEGARRPTHFEGVAIVVAKLFNIVRPARAYFGQKDARQSVVVRRLVRDLDFDLDIVVCPTVREADGLAMSSRNKYLIGDQRPAATVLNRALRTAERLWSAGTRNGEALRQTMLAVLADEPLAQVDYVSAADPTSLAEWPADVPPGAGVLLSLAVFIGRTRLIDNILLDDSSPANE